MTRFMVVLLACFSLGFTFVGCESKKDDAEKSSGPARDKFDASEFAEGSSQTVNLAFWMLETCVEGDRMAPCAHFDDADKQRVIFWLGEGNENPEWEQKKVYSVTFDYKPNPDMAMLVGTLTKVVEAE